MEVQIMENEKRYWKERDIINEIVIVEEKL